MGSIRVRNDSLFFDFRYLGERCREQTLLPDTKSNRKKLEKIMERMEAEITLGSFEYAKYFPNSSMVKKIEVIEIKQQPNYTETPLFKDFAEEWFSEMFPTWRRATAEGYRRYLDKRLIPHFGEMEVSRITKAEILKYRSIVAKLSDGKLKAKTINKFIKCLGMIMNEAADRYNFTPPHLNIKPLKEEKVHISPFSIQEVNLMLANVRFDWRDYLLVRFFTGMRTGEIDGLKWENVDFERREILIRETFSGSKWEYTKNDSSQREIEMSTIVYNTLKERYDHRNPECEMVFHANNGAPVHTPNFLRRVWTPLLNYLGIKYRKPYQTRHTAATLWLAAGENPNWIARQMGHSTTNMLFSVYARYVPNLTRRDGSAMERMLASQVDGFHSPQTESYSDSNTNSEVNGESKDSNLKTVAMESAFWDQFVQPTQQGRQSS
ncbi:MAG: integrase [Piscirickettsiaceae bacterium CG_4_9_14_3_um_filter_43_564]|nr:site-specific integrase [Thiomicrospira sp.]NCN67371.1 site-specific integrase [Thiomicrospira sp.]NCO13611.1 site-specific integrase [Thiomicrospira sp.]PJA66170.1 MAG: integrase [Piscirickettsiaceae bacterium CG_4_9_14_3_um_filter_43_564]